MCGENALYNVIVLNATFREEPQRRARQRRESDKNIMQPLPIAVGTYSHT